MVVHPIETKDRAVKDILWGLLLQSVPFSILAFLENNALYTHFLFGVLSSFLFLVGYVFLVKGSFHYLKAKGHSTGWTALAIFSFLGISMILFLTVLQLHKASSESMHYSKEEFFRTHNVIELLLLFAIALPLLYMSLLAGAYSLGSGIGFFQIMESLNTPESGSSILSNIALILSFGHFGLFLIQSFQKSGIPYSQFWRGLKHVNIREIGIISLLEFLFAMSLGTITIYGLSHIFPQSVENYLNESRITSITSLGTFAFSAIIMAPVVEELLFRGFILQKWASKWSIQSGVLSSSLLFAVCHFNFHIPSLFIGGILLSTVYVRTKNLISPILLHSFYNFFVMAWISIDFWGKSVPERREMISITEYQQLIEPLLPRRFLLLALCTPAILYYLYKKFPKKNTSLPSLAVINEDVTDG